MSMAILHNSGRLQNLGGLQDRVYQERICDINELKQCLVDVWSDFGRQSLMGPSMSGESGIRHVSVWKVTILNKSC